VSGWPLLQKKLNIKKPLTCKIPPKTVKNRLCLCKNLKYPMWSCLYTIQRMAVHLWYRDTGHIVTEIFPDSQVLFLSHSRYFFIIQSGIHVLISQVSTLYLPSSASTSYRYPHSSQVSPPICAGTRLNVNRLVSTLYVLRLVSMLYFVRYPHSMY